MRPYSIIEEIINLRKDVAKRMGNPVPPPSPLFTHLGAKNQLWPSLEPILRRVGTKKIAEPFAGSAVVSRHFPAKQILLAEASDDVRSILQALKTGDPERLFRQMLMTKVEPDLQTDIYPEQEKAAKALADRIFKAPMGQDLAPTNQLLMRRLEGFVEANKILKNAVILSDAWDLIRRYKNDPEVTWFLDPPYPETCQVGYADCWTMADHERLIKTIPTLKGPVVLTGYENMRPPKSVEMKEKAVSVIRRIAKGANRDHTEYIWWRPALASEQKSQPPERRESSSMDEDEDADGMGVGTKIAIGGAIAGGLALLYLLLKE